MWWWELHCEADNRKTKVMICLPTADFSWIFSCVPPPQEREREKKTKFYLNMSALQLVSKTSEAARKLTALLININAAKGLQNVLQSNLGPRGTMKMYVCVSFFWTFWILELHDLLSKEMLILFNILKRRIKILHFFDLLLSKYTLVKFCGGRVTWIAAIHSLIVSSFRLVSAGGDIKITKDGEVLLKEMVSFHCHVAARIDSWTGPFTHNYFWISIFHILQQRWLQERQQLKTTLWAMEQPLMCCWLVRSWSKLSVILLKDFILVLLLMVLNMQKSTYTSFKWVSMVLDLLFFFFSLSLFLSIFWKIRSGCDEKLRLWGGTFPLTVQSEITLNHFQTIFFLCFIFVF